MATASDCAQKLQSAAKGLLYPSEADKPVKVVSGPAEAGTGPITADLVRALCKLPDEAPARELTLDEFFQPVTAVMDWYGPDEKARAAGFQELESVVRGLKDPRAFRFGETTAELIVVGRDDAGNLAGVRTQVVET